MARTAEGSTVVDTSLGKVEYLDHGDGPPVLFVHGSPGGCDQGAVMTEFLVARGFRTVSISRPGYLGSPLTDQVAEPDQQADLELALVDTLGIGTFAVMCWSGGGPSSYRLAAKHPDRVSALVTLAAVSMQYEFANGINSIEYSLLTGAVGNWVLKEMVKHAPKSVVGMVASEEGDLTKEQAHALTEHIWNDETKRDFVMKVSATISGRHDGLKNDKQHFPEIGDLGLVEHLDADAARPRHRRLRRAPRAERERSRAPAQRRDPSGAGRDPPVRVDRPDLRRGPSAHHRPPEELTFGRGRSGPPARAGVGSPTFSFRRTRTKRDDSGLAGVLPRVDVVLVVPPFAPTFQPSIACHQLQACARQRGHDVIIVYANLLFASIVGHGAYERMLERGLSLEHIFKDAAFGPSIDASTGASSRRSWMASARSSHGFGDSGRSYGPLLRRSSGQRARSNRSRRASHC